MQELTVKLYRITVVFNSTYLENPISLVCDDFRGTPILNNTQLPIPQGIALILLDLVTLPAGTTPAAEFTEDPITWVNESEPPSVVPQSPAFTLQKFPPYHLTIVDFNTVKFPQSHKFLVNTVYNGVSYSSDPTIVNEPPIQ